MDWMTAPPEDLRSQNKILNLTSREHAALIGAIWYAIEVRELWKEWGYDFFNRCIEQEQERGYSTVMECILNYRFFVIESQMSFDEFTQLLRDQGVAKVSCVRRDSVAAKGTASGETKTDAALPLADSPARPRNDVLEGIRQSAERIAPMTVREAKKAVAAPQVFQMVYLKVGLTKEEYELFELAIEHIKKRARREISRDRALGYLITEYCSTTGMRPLVDEEEAA